MPSRRVIIVMIEPPLPFGNAAARWFYVLLRGLVARGHRVTAFAACSKPSEIEAAARLFPAPAFDLRLYPFPTRRGLRAKLETLRRPYSYMFSRDLKRDLVAELARGCDVLHLEQLWTGRLGLDQSDRAVVNVHHLVQIDQEFLRPNSPRAVVERLLSFGTERRLLRGFRWIRACSPRLEAAIRTINPRAEVVTIPVGIDASLYEYSADDQRAPEPRITLIGSMLWYPGRSAAERLLTRLWPRIRAAVPAARLTIAGWSARSALARWVDAPGVTIVENVAETASYFRATSVFVYAPSRGSGMKIKILEAMAQGVPVVTTSEGVEGLPAVDGVHAGIADDDDGLVERAVELLRDPSRQNAQRAAGRRLIESHCGPQATLDATEQLYERICRERR